MSISNHGFYDYLLLSEQKIRRIAPVTLRLHHAKTNGTTCIRDYLCDGFRRGEGFAMLHVRHPTKKLWVDLSSPSISSAADVSSGEIIGDLIDYLEARYREHPTYQLDQWETQYGLSLAVLVYLAEKNERLNPAQRAILRQFFDENGGAAISDEPFKQLIANRRGFTAGEIRSHLRKLSDVNVSNTLPYIEPLKDSLKNPPSEYNTFMCYLKKHIEKHKK